MRFPAFVLAAAAGALAAPEGPRQPVFSCGTPRPDADEGRDIRLGVIHCFFILQSFIM